MNQIGLHVDFGKDKLNRSVTEGSQVLVMQTEAYKYEITVRASRERVVEILSDPFLFAGISGHMEIVKVFDSAVQDFVELAEAKSPTARFKVAYIFDIKDGKTSTEVGEMTGPVFTPEGVSYSGFTEDGKLNWSLNIEVKGITGTESQVRFSGNVECEESFVGRLLLKWKSCGELLEKMVKGHIIPYLFSFLRSTPSARLQVTPTLVYSEVGTLSEVMPKVFRAVQGVHYGMVVIIGEDVKGRLLIADGNISEMNVTMGLEVITDVSAIVRLLNSQSGAKVYVYSVNVEQQVREVLDQVYNEVMKKELFGSS